MSLALADRVVVVVGGTTGLGLSAARAFITAGARVVVVGRNPESVSQAAALLGKDAIARVGDATSPDTATLAIQAALSQFHRFDGLYHVAGGSGRRLGDGPLDSITDAGWAGTFELNLTSLFYSNRAAACQFLKQQSGGVVLNMASVLGYSPSPKFFSTHAYAAAKAAIIGLTRSSAAYYAAKNIRFNVIAPALVATPMSERAQTNDAIMTMSRLLPGASTGCCTATAGSRRASKPSSTGSTSTRWRGSQPPPWALTRSAWCGWPCRKPW